MVYLCERRVDGWVVATTPSLAAKSAKIRDGIAGASANCDGVGGLLIRYMNDIGPWTMLSSGSLVFVYRLRSLYL